MAEKPSYVIVYTDPTGRVSPVPSPVYDKIRNDIRALKECVERIKPHWNNARLATVKILYTDVED